MPTVVLAEPRTLQASLLEQSLAKQFTVVRAKDEVDALRLLAEHDAVALVAGLKLTTALGGLRLAQKARHAHGELITVVYGGRDIDLVAGRGRELEQLYRLNAFIDWPPAGRPLGHRLRAAVAEHLPSVAEAA